MVKNSASDLQLAYRYTVSTDPTEGRYDTIQAAIDAAVADGATAANPKNVFLKTGTYSEAVTLKDGVFVVGDVKESTIFTGTMVIDGSTGLSNLTISATANVFTINSLSKFSMSNCSVTITGFPLFNNTTAFGITITPTDCSFRGIGAAATFMSSTDDNSIVTLISKSSSYNFQARSSLAGIFGAYTISHLNDEIIGGYDIAGTALELNFKGCTIKNVGANYFLECTDPSASGKINFVENRAELANTSYIFTDGSALTFSMVGDTIVSTSGAPRLDLSVGSHGLIQYNLSTGLANNSGETSSGPRSVQRGSALVQSFGYLNQTGIASGIVFAKQIASIEGVTIYGTITGKIGGVAESWGGPFSVHALNNGGTIIITGSWSTEISGNMTPNPTISFGSTGTTLEITVNQALGGGETAAYQVTTWTNTVSGTA